MVDSKGCSVDSKAFLSVEHSVDSTAPERAEWWALERAVRMVGTKGIVLVATKDVE